MFRYLILFSFALGLSSCGTTKIQPLAIDADSAAHNDHFTGEEKSIKSKRAKKAPKRLAVDDSKPATYNQYRQWREKNDPDSQTYAEYKAWEAAYNRWKKEQTNTAKQ